MNKALRQLLMVCCAAGTLTAQFSQKAATNPGHVSFILDDTAGVSSDGLGAYIDGKDSVSVSVSSVGDFQMTFYAASSRSLKVNYANPVDPLDSPFTGVHVVNAASTSSWSAITVHDLLSIQVGATALRNGYILVQKNYVDANGIPHVAGQNWNTANGNTAGPLFSVTRTEKNQWIIQSQTIPNGDVTALKFFHDTGNSWVFESQSYYHIPIRITLNR